ncbi:MAG TPA: hypothetical protein VF529_04160 [Solirubrobacteraceae bacterium]|jgi:hypothetical protein
MSSQRLRAAGRVMGDLTWTLAPLTIPLLGVVLIGALLQAWWVAVIAFGLALAIVVPIVRRVTRRSGSRTMRETMGTPPFLAFFAAMIALIASVPIVLGIVGDGDASAYAAWSEVLVWAGFLLWAVVLLLRLPLFARTPWRRLFAVLLAIAFVRYFLWAFAGGETTLTSVDHVAWPVLLLAALVGVWWSECPPAESPQRVVSRSGDLGLVAAVLAAATFVVSGIVSQRSTPPIDRSEPGYAIARSGDLGAPPDVSDLLDDRQRLANAFAPRVEMTDDERWRPTEVEAYLRSADLVEKGRAREDDRVIDPRPLSPQELPARCPAGTAPPCFFLTIHCTLEHSEESDCEEDPQRDRERGLAYARVLRRSDPGAADAFPAVGPFHEELDTIVQYWLFYYYDDWRARTIFGDVRQGHEGDWESVTVGVSAKRPLFVALSSHCAGTWLAWEDVRVADQGRRTHPMVAVAEGSQANYADPDESIPPNIGRCRGFRQREVEALTLAYEVRERTGAAVILPLEALLVDDSSPVMRFPGRWGRDDRIWFETAFGRRYRLARVGGGPESPGQKNEWDNPVTDVFCDPRWKKVGETEVPSDGRC